MGTMAGSSSSGSGEGVRAIDVGSSEGSEGRTVDQELELEALKSPRLSDITSVRRSMFR